MSEGFELAQKTDHLVANAVTELLPRLPLTAASGGILRRATLREDCIQATDLVFTSGQIRIATRCRAARYMRRYPYDFTLRAHSSRGGRSEFEKILGGWGNYLFYCFVNEEETALIHGRMIDLGVFRVRLPKRGCPNDAVENGDGSAFHHYDVREFPPELIVTEWPRIAEQRSLFVAQ